MAAASGMSDAFVVGEDWISEHYFTADTAKESFQGRVLVRRKEWDAEEAETTRDRFTAARREVESRLIGLTGLVEEDDASPDKDAASPTLRPLTDEQRGEVLALDGQLLTVFGYRTGEFTLREDGPITWVTPTSMPDNPPLAIVAARPVATVDDLITKKASTLLSPWAVEGEDDPHPVTSVSAALSAMMTDPEGPAFALVLAGRWCLVAEKERWPEGRWLAVDLQLVCERNDTRRGGEIDRALAILEAASLAPDASGIAWWRETLDDSVKHTAGVSKDLQEGVRLSIEIIANEVLRRRAAQGLPELAADQAQPLAKQALRYLYRILFLLYAEASPELGVLPVGAQEYDAGYGLDRLRDLALTEIYSDKARHGTHLYESLDRLFVLVDRGHEPAGDPAMGEGLTFNGLRADLFRPEATALIDEVKLGNGELLKVLQKLLLSKESSKQQRGFISYVELGINQLGAVYEGLMSYTGSFATEDLYEVAKNGDSSKGSWVVPVDRSDHLDQADFVTVTDEETGETRPVLHRKGTFVFRLSGRDRQRSASYYTPEVLTRFTVQQALEELLDQDGQRTSAEEILRLSVCEPALGSGAFAIEAVRQLAEEYLSRREEELGERVDPEQRPAELQKVKAHIALHQVYGVDLNATAVELAEVSLWLDTMVAGLAAPWFGLRLRRGNSLVGARRAVYAPSSLATRAWLTDTPKDVPLWARLNPNLPLVEEPPGSEATRARLETTGDIPENAIHHFLLPAQGWGSAVEVPKAVRDLVPPEALKKLKTWRGVIRKAPSKTQVKRLQALATRVEALWGLALRRLQVAEAESSRAIDVWNRPDEGPAPSTVTREQIEASLADPEGAYRRLRAVMDAWCALWYWPLTEEPVEPPTLEQWLSALEGILGTPIKEARNAPARGDGSLFTATAWESLNDEETNDRSFSQARPMDAVLAENEWLRVCAGIAEEQGFFHWELDYATVFARGGFDLQVGNPPWVRPDVQLDYLLAEDDPWWMLETKPSVAAQKEQLRRTLARPGSRKAVVDGATDVQVLGEFISDTTVYPLMEGRPDLYRVFMCAVWARQSKRGISSLIHMETHFTDAKTPHLRAATYQHLRRHWEFINELGLFEIQNQKHFGTSVYGSPREPHFLQATSLYHPETVLRSLAHDGSGDEPGFKDPSTGTWDLRPHAARVQLVDSSTLRTWQAVTEAESWASTPMVYTVNSASARTLATMAERPRIGSLNLQFSSGWNETTDFQKGRFVKAWGDAPWKDAILQGPHLYVSTPLYKQPNETMSNQRDWSTVDLESLPADAEPVTSYKPAGDRATYDSLYTHWGATSARDHYRIAWRNMAPLTGERTLTPALIPPGAAHVHTVASAGGPDIGPRTLVLTQALASSLLADFWIRSSGRGHIDAKDFNRLPRLDEDHPLTSRVILRALRLNCVTNAYADLWAACWDNAYTNDEPILPRFDERPIGPTWTEDTPLRRAADRRNTQVEIDAMVAIMLGIPIEDLVTIYKTQFAVLYGYDKTIYTYDANGRLVPNKILTEWRNKGETKTNEELLEEDRTAARPGSDLTFTYDLPFGVFDREFGFSAAKAAIAPRDGVSDD